jgi:hypothetical protein
LQCCGTATKVWPIHAPLTCLIDRFPPAAKRGGAEFVDLLVPEDKLRGRVARILADNFAEEAKLGAEAQEQAGRCGRGPRDTP